MNRPRELFMHPLIARNIFRLQESLLGRPSFRILGELLESERWTPAVRQELRRERLQRLLWQAYTHTPYWRAVMDANGIHPRDIHSIYELQRFPLLEKVRNQKKTTF